MPLLEKELDLYPENLFEQAATPAFSEGAQWWGLYTLSRHEKQLMRKLVGLEVPFYGPMVGRRYKSPGGRARTSYEPLFTNYVFIYGDEGQRYRAQTTNCVSHWLPVVDGDQLTRDLEQIHRLIELGCPLTPEARLVKGDSVRVRTGIFAGFEGIVIRREGKMRLLVSVSFAQQGASVLLDDCQLDRL